MKVVESLMTPSPINRGWVVDGAAARIREIARDRSGYCLMVIWECERGRFRWEYEFDEVLYLVEGSAKLEHDGRSVEVNAGDVVQFHRGTKVSWTVTTPVRKIAWIEYSQGGIYERVKMKLRNVKRAMRK